MSALGVAQLGGGHPVELAMTEHLGRAVGIGRDDEPFDRLVVLALVRAGARRALEPAQRLAVARRLHGRVAAARLVGSAVSGSGIVVGGRSLGSVIAAAPEAVEGLVVRLALVPPAYEDGRAGRPDLLLVADVDERQSAGEVDRGAEVDPQPDRAQGPPEDDRLAERAVAPATSGSAQRGRSATRGDLLEVRGRVAPRIRADVLLVLEDDAEGLVGDGRRELTGTEGEQRGRPVERLGHAGDLGQVGLAETMDEGDDLARPAAPARPERGRGRSRARGRGSGSRSSGRGSGA